MKIGIVASDGEEWHVKQIREELKNRRIENYVFPANRFYSRIAAEPRVSVRGHSLEDFNAIIVRKVPGGSPEQVFYRMDVLHRLEDLGIYVMNPAESIERAVDKYYTSTILEDAGIRTPRTLVTERFDEAVKGFDELGGDVVVKPLFGSLGMGMTRITDKEVAYRVFRALEMTSSVYYLQEFIPHSNRDIRAFVIGERVVASMLRVADGWKTNISGGAKAEYCELEHELVDLSVKSTEALGLHYSGVDILKSERDGYHYVVELNSTPGWQGLQTVTEKRIVGIIVDHLISKIS